MQKTIVGFTDELNGTVYEADWEGLKSLHQLMLRQGDVTRDALFAKAIECGVAVPVLQTN